MTYTATEIAKITPQISAYNGKYCYPQCLENTIENKLMVLAEEITKLENYVQAEIEKKLCHLPLN